MAKLQFNIRVYPDLMNRFEDKCRREGVTKTSIIESLMSSWLDGRVLTPSAFPAQQEEAGDSPLNPIFIAWGADER